MMERHIKIQDLILEVTRRCNMKCAHCLRGDAEALDMPEQLIDRLLADVDEISELVFSGGEPFLNVDIMRYTLEYVKEHEIPVYNIYVVTNGKEVKDEYLQVMDDWMIYLMRCFYKADEFLPEDTYMPMTGDDLMAELNYSGVSISRDIYHEAIPVENYLKWRTRSYYSSAKERGTEHYDLVNEGRAQENGIGSRERVIPFYITIDEDGVSVDQLYISADGSTVADCDLSYESVEERSIGNVMEESLYDILVREGGANVDIKS